jgi:hypothetical protein
MRAREMMARLDRLPKKRGEVPKVWDLSLLSPEKQDRVGELFRLILGSKDINSENLVTLFAELDELVRDLLLLGPDDPEQGPSIEVPRGLARYWQWQPTSKWRPLDFHKLSKVQTLRFVELCERHGFTDETDTPEKAQMLPLHAWRSRDRAELQGLLDRAVS